MPILTSNETPHGHEADVSPASVLKARLVKDARALGFETVRVTAPGAIGDAGKRLGEFLASGRHGDMSWMEKNAERRADPRELWPDVRTIILLAMSYAPDDDPLSILSEPARGAISVYAKGRDYHDVMKAKLKKLAAAFAADASCAVKVFVDTAPLMEKPLAAAAGIGWQGKHTNLVSRTDGSWLFLGAILADCVLEPDAAEVDHCGRCRRCLDVCPTKAFPAPYQLDARRCIAYLTIEHKGHIAREFRAAIGNRIFGCDDCLAVCPWNKFAEAARETKFAASVETDNPPLAELLPLNDAEFRRRFAGTPVKRTGRERFTRNVLIAAGNSDEPALLPLIAPLTADESPIIRAMAAWSFARLADDPEFSGLRARRLAVEKDEAVRREWCAEPNKDPEVTP
jgi:epoxyqueuosine reductase